MNHQSDRFDYLYRQYINRTCSQEEMQELFRYVSDPVNRNRLEAIADEHLEQLQLPEAYPEVDWEFMYRKIMPAGGAVGELNDSKRAVIRRLPFRTIAAAAVILIMLMAGGYWFLIRTPKRDRAIDTSAAKNIAPGGNKAVLTLADGSNITLDSAANGKLVQQGNSVVNKTKDGELKYEVKSTKYEVAYNTLSTPRGGQYQLVLPDGSKVWLNAASSITYPTAFIGNERKVTISGEAYFEVAKNAKMPFIVQEGVMSVQVLGTHFNVNGYDDEDAVRTTLLEGSVKVTRGAASVIIKPGEQVSVSHSSQLSQPIPVQTEEVMAWKDGRFAFNDATIESIMRQAARWYDVDVVYDATITKHFVANIPRSVPLSELLNLLELTDQVHFKVQGKKVTIIQ